MTVALRRALPAAGRRPRRALVAGVAVAAVAVAGAAALAAWPDPEGAGSAAAVGSAAAPVSYAVTYEVTYDDGSEVVERVAVERPFRSEVRAADASRVSELGVLATAGGDDAWVRIEVPVAIASGDLRPEAVLADAVAAGHVEVRDQHRVAGAACREHRFGGPVSSGVLTPVGTTPGEHADVCIDDRGLVLRERWVVDGRTVRERTATAVDAGDVAVDTELTGAVRELAVAAGGGSVEEVDPDHDPGFSERWELDVPGGFEHAGRWLVVPPTLERPDPTVARRAEVALVTDAWVRGADVLLLDQGATVAGVAPPWDERPVTATRRLPAVGAADVVWDLRSSEVRITRPDGGFVRVSGTLPPDQLVAIARTLVPTARGEGS